MGLRRRGPLPRRRRYRRVGGGPAAGRRPGRTLLHCRRLPAAPPAPLAMILVQTRGACPSSVWTTFMAHAQLGHVGAANPSESLARVAFSCDGPASGAGRRRPGLHPGALPAHRSSGLSVAEHHRRNEGKKYEILAVHCAGGLSVAEYLSLWQLPYSRRCCWPPASWRPGRASPSQVRPTSD